MNFEIPGEHSITLGKKILISILLLVALLLYLLPLKIAGQFVTVFNSFGTELPLLTSIFLIIPPLFILTALLGCFSLIIWINRPKQNQIHAFRLGLINFILSCLYFGGFIFAMYLPSFTLGNVI